MSSQLIHRDSRASGRVMVCQPNEASRRVTRALPRKISMVMAFTLLASCVQPSLIRQDPAVSQAQVERGIMLIEMRDYKAAKAELTRARPFKTADPRALMALAVASDMEGDFRTSDKAYEMLLSRAPDQAGLFNNMGYSYMLRGDLEKAASYLEEAARRSADNETIKNNLIMLKRAAPL